MRHSKPINLCALNDHVLRLAVDQHIRRAGEGASLRQVEDDVEALAREGLEEVKVVVRGRVRLAQHEGGVLLLPGLRAQVEPGHPPRQVNLGGKSLDWGGRLSGHYLHYQIGNSKDKMAWKAA